MTAKKVGMGAVVVVAAGLLLPITNLVVGLPAGITLGKAGPDAPAQLSQALAALALKCGNCHTPDGAIPFYASIPPARGLIAEHIREGVEYLDLASELAETPARPAREVVLAKLEHTIDWDTMPPMSYMLLHWNGAFTAAEKEAVSTWIRQERAEHYASSAAPEALRSSVLQPLPAPPRDLDEAKVTLGAALYRDPRLSKDNTISCASCHALDKGGTDRAQFSTGVGGAEGGINAPTVFNAALSIAQFWDGRAADLQAQADGPPNNPIEMASSWPEIVGKLEADAELKQRFVASYPEGFSKDTITDAIALFEQTLLTPGSPFDKYLLGDESALDSEAKAGYALFLEHACATCHVGMALGGQSYETMGRHGDYFADRGKVTEADAGRYNVTKNEQDRHKFKVPTLRNVAQTAPYMHDGTVDSLEKAVVLMGKYQVGVDFTPGQSEQIAAFLLTLTGYYDGWPVQ